MSPDGVPRRLGRWMPLVSIDRVLRQSDDEEAVESVLRPSGREFGWTEKFIRDAEVALARLGERYPFEYFVVEGHECAPLLIRSTAWNPRLAALVAPRIDGPDEHVKFTGKPLVMNVAHTVGIVNASVLPLVPDPDAGARALAALAEVA